MAAVSSPGRLDSAPLLRDLAAALMWFVVIVPPSFGFWLVAGDLAGVPDSSRQTLILASLLCMGIATLAQVKAGHRLPVFEGPASTYLAAVAVLSIGSAAGHPEAVTGGLLAAGFMVFAFGALGADRVFRRIFTPPVVTAFMLIVTLTVVRPTLERAIGHSSAHPWGVSSAWISTAVVVLVGVGGQAIAALRSSCLLLALVAGTAAYAVTAGVPPAAAGHGWATPTLFPWGAPELSGSIVAPFLIAGLLASFNTIASVNVMSITLERPLPPSSERRALLSHGVMQAAGACLGNVLGNVARLESSAIVRMIGNPRPRALAIAATAAIALAFLSPVVALLARLPIPVSAALVAVVLGMMFQQSLREAAKLEPRRRWLVVAPAVVPAIVWVAISSSLSEHAQLLGNPLVIGVALAVVLDRLVAQRGPAAKTFVR
jgi:xanthine/uracil permease